MMIKNNILILIMSFMAIGFMNAQDNDRKGRKGERIAAQKVAFISNTIDLTTEEAQSFWPIYNRHEKRVQEIKQEFRMDERIENMTDQEVDKTIDNMLVKESQLLNEKKAYVADLKKILPSRKIALLYKAEMKFRSKVLKEVRKRMGKKEKRK